MRNGFTSGMLIGGIVGATMSMIMNHDIDMNKTKTRMMRMGKNMYRKSRRIVSDITDMMH
jgi:gas vesicle protein